MIAFLLVLIFVTSALSLISYVYCWHDICNGRPHIVSLRQILGIMDRHRITRLLGRPEPGFYYLLTPQTIGKLLRARRWYYWRECAADMTCLLGSWMYLTGNVSDALLFPFVLLAGTCQGINVVYSLWLIRKWSAQLREEIDNSDRY